ncbi:hypothetical protein GCK72_007968 [Caenorhabditis remanei]|uniref:Uncharacterized protein n=1 Tax=Caenorhabditis remanei TaxID=31234 RepID=A0A6A5HNW8_CAERE|nr:hypothetical protein GCK72_007968 [Caenorhabditis remanei]KAF1768007.1 hypothetical protein GCK72_007968 [Caenorhabditis remanei]
MRNYWLLLFTALAALAYANDQQPHDISRNVAVKEGNHLRVDLNETSSEELMDKWLSQAFSGLMAAVASKKISKVSAEHQELIQKCSKEAKDVPSHAKCIVKLMDEAEKKIHVPKNRKPYQKVVKTTTEEPKENMEWIGSFGTARARRSSGFNVVQKDNYSLRSTDDMDGMTRLAKSMTNTARVFKNKTEKSEPWIEAVGRIKKLREEAKREKKNRDIMKKRLRQMIDNTPAEFIDPRKPVALKQAEMEDEKTEISKMMRKKEADEIRVPLKFLREAVKTAMMLGGKNVSDFDQKTLKMVSPRIMSIVPEQEDDSLFNLLSPSLFSLHDEGEGVEKLTSLPHLLKKLDNHGQNAWMDFIVEAAGVSDHVTKTEKTFREKKEKELRGPDGVPLYFTKENATKIIGEEEKSKIEVFEYLDKSYDENQKKKLNEDGFAFLTEHQMEKLYGKGSPYNHTKALKKFKRLRDDPERYIEKDIRALAEAEKFRVARRADIVGSPFILTPLTFASVPLSNKFIVLSPLVLSPITLSPAVLGPIILSPWVFVPLVLSPRVLSPLILNPLVFSPIVLSPLVLHPLILVPGVFNPIILSPLLLSPLILSPQVFTPLILSPFALNPLILTPMVGSPLVLSPFVLSPIILSPQALFAVVLSPYALSPLIESKLIAAEVVLSPSWLS